MKQYIISILLGICIAVLALSTASAAPLPTTFVSPVLPPVDLGSINSWLALLGVLPLVPIVIELLKRVGVVKDGTAAVWSSLGNILLFFVLTVLGVVGVDVSGDAATDVYAILIQLGTLLLMVFGSPAMYKLARAFGIVKPLPGR
jgi:hypothetical protein